MGKVTSEISMSLDGFITGPNVGVGNGMGDDGDRLHDWMFDAKTEVDAAIVDEIVNPLLRTSRRGEIRHVTGCGEAVIRIYSVSRAFSDVR